MTVEPEPEHAQVEPEPVEPRRTRRSVFVGWHRTEQLWREIYVRTVSALCAALVIYLVAALSGVVTRKPLPWVCLVGAAFCAWLAWGQAVGTRRGDEYANTAGAVWFAGAAVVFVGFGVYGFAQT